MFEALDRRQVLLAASGLAAGVMGARAQATSSTVQTAAPSQSVRRAMTLGSQRRVTWLTKRYRPASHPLIAAGNRRIRDAIVRRDE